MRRAGREAKARKRAEEACAAAEKGMQGAQEEVEKLERELAELQRKKTSASPVRLGAATPTLNPQVRRTHETFLELGGVGGSMGGKGLLKGS